MTLETLAKDIAASADADAKAIIDEASFQIAASDSDRAPLPQKIIRTTEKTESPDYVTPMVLVGKIFGGQLCGTRVIQEYRIDSTN